MKLKFYRIIFTILIIALLAIIAMIGTRYFKRYQNEKENKDVVATFSRSIQEDSSEDVTMNGYKVIGIVKIPKIEIEYPILDIDTYNPEETKEPMKISIVKYWGVNVNEYGNLSIAGHNNHDGTMFGKTKRLEIGDIVELTDLNGNKVEYQIYSKFVTDPNDVTILLANDEKVREVTLITCTNGNRERLILKAREKI